MTPTATPMSLNTPNLYTEAAIAAHIIRAGLIPRQLFHWTFAPADLGKCEDPFCEPDLTLAMDEIFAPLLVGARSWEKRSVGDAAAWLATTCRYIAAHYREVGLGSGPRLLAASLLPLYRSLAADNLHDGYQQTRFRLSELLTLLALSHAVGEDFVRIIDGVDSRGPAPSVICKKHLGFDLVHVAAISRELVTGFDVQSERFSDEAKGELRRIDQSAEQPVVAQWAAPELIWRLSGELISESSELTLPRSWVETPVPWSSIRDHWHSFERLLSTTSISRDLPHLTRSEIDANGNASAHADSLDFVETAATSTSRLLTSPPEKQLSAPGLEFDATETTPAHAGDSKRRLVATARKDDPEAAGRLDGDCRTKASSRPNPSQPLVPKVLIAEIHTHNDPVFVNVLRRQIASCRIEDRSISLASIVVVPEHESDHEQLCGNRENGLALWQQKLVNWLADHPEVVEPQAFLTSRGELLLSLLDVERNECTTLLRDGLVEVLSGQPASSDRSNTLACVNAPARYHLGLAATATPAAGFTAEQLIEPTIRCLAAAMHQGKSSIKSIEVY